MSLREFVNLRNFLLLCRRQRLHIDAIILNFCPKRFLLFPHPSLALSLSDGISFQLLYDWKLPSKGSDSFSNIPDVLDSVANAEGSFPRQRVIGVLSNCCCHPFETGLPDVGRSCHLVTHCVTTFSIECHSRRC